HQDQRREDAADAPPVEAGEREAAAAELVEDDPGDQETRDHEEHVDADEAARHGAREGVIAEHRQHRDRAQPVDVGTIGVHRARDHLPHFRRGARSGQPATLVRTVVRGRWNMRRPLATLTTSMDTQAAAIRRYFDAASEHYASRRADEYSFVVQKR